jgi:hypothetical protein
MGWPNFSSKRTSRKQWRWTPRKERRRLRNLIFRGVQSPSKRSSELSIIRPKRMWRLPLWGVVTTFYSSELKMGVSGPIRRASVTGHPIDSHQFGNRDRMQRHPHTLLERELTLPGKLTSCDCPRPPIAVVVPRFAPSFVVRSRVVSGTGNRLQYKVASHSNSRLSTIRAHHKTKTCTTTAF